MPEGAEEGIIKGMYLLRRAREAQEQSRRVQLLGSGTILREVIAAADLLAEDWGISADIWSVPSFTELRREAIDAERWNLLHPTEPPRQSYVETVPDRPEGPVVAATDYMRLFADQIRPWVPGRYRVLGTDGFGRSDYRRKLRALLRGGPALGHGRGPKALADEGTVEPRGGRRDQEVRARPREAEPDDGLNRLTLNRERRRNRAQETTMTAMTEARAARHDRSESARYRRLQGRPDHRDPREGGRRDQRRRPAAHARVRQGDDGGAGAAGGHGGDVPGQDRRQGQRGHADPDVQGRRGRHDPAALAGLPAGAAAAAPAGGGGEHEPASGARRRPRPTGAAGATTGARRLRQRPCQPRACAGWRASSASI